MILATLTMLMINRMCNKYPMKIGTKRYRVRPPMGNEDITIQSYNRAYQVTFSDHVPNEKVLVIDENVYNLNRPMFESFEHKFLVRADETNKTIQTSVDLVNFLTSINFTKSDGLVVVGGGITQDLSAFTAAIYKRGIRWTFMPTTLLSMCDSCIGAKSCLNVDGTKNQVGTFYPPNRVIINLAFLKTLNPTDVDSGLGEMYKLYAIGGLEWEGVRPDEDAIRTALAIKKVVIEDDEFEKGPRAALNYGHTFGHVFEAMSNFKIPHGIAVLMGMYVVDLYFGQNVNKYDRHLPLIEKYLKFLNPDEDVMFQHLAKDKKVSGTKISLVCCERGHSTFVKTPLSKEIVKKVAYSINKLKQSLPVKHAQPRGTVNPYLGAPTGWI